MGYKITKEEMHTVVKLDANKRYTYCIKRIIDNEEIWSLYDSEGWVLFSDSNGVEVFPIWSDENYANYCSQHNFEGCKPQKISLNMFMEKWINGLVKDQRKIAVFPVCNPKKILDQGVEVSPLKIYDDFLNELDNY